MYADLYSLILEEGKKQDLCELIAGYGHVYTGLWTFKFPILHKDPDKWNYT